MIQAKIVADSLSPQGNRITTMQVTFPRFILAELNTHRLFSRNSASSRAIPFAKMVKSVEENPFIPIAWQKDHKGMQGTEYLLYKDHIDRAEDIWLHARDNAVKSAKDLSQGVWDGDSVFEYDDAGDYIPEYGYIGITKQLCNRLLEPFMWHTVLITSTEWENFFNLRCPMYLQESSWNIRYAKSRKEYLSQIGLPDNPAYYDKWTHLDWLQINKGQSEIHMMALAEAMYDAMNESKPKQLQAEEWHIPFGEKIYPMELLKAEDFGYVITGDDEMNYWNTEHGKKEYFDKFYELKIKIATARCARVSYTVVGEEGKESNFKKNIKLHDSLLESGHFSPFEHCARAMSDEEYNSFIKGDTNNDGVDFKTTLGWCNNFKGFIQYRYLIENQ